MQRSGQPAIAANAAASLHRRLLIAALTLIIVVSAALRLVALDARSGYMFDERYYAADAALVLKGGLSPSSSWRPGLSSGEAHPELGVLSIAAGIAALGDGPWGWRIMSALAGTLLIALVYPLARRVGLKPGWALAATVLAAADTMLLVQSRIAMLDIFVALWTAACVYCALRAVQSRRYALWVFLCGLAGGAALASKWSGGLAVIAALVVLLLAQNRRPGAHRLALTAGAVIGLSLLMYVVGYAPYFLAGHSPGQWLHLQRYMVGNDLHKAGAASASQPWSWPFDIDAIWYTWSIGRSGVVGVLALGNPLLWWTTIIATVATLVTAVRRRQPRSAFPVLLMAILYVPWLFTSRGSYIYYMTPIVPFMAIVVAAWLSRLGDPGRQVRACALGFAGGLVGLAAFGAAGLGEGAAGLLQGGAVIRTAALAAGLTLTAVALLAAARSASRREALGTTCAWVYVGATGGFMLVYLPFLIAYPVLFQYYERITLLPTWK